jgi:hypothetical protein
LDNLKDYVTTAAVVVSLLGTIITVYIGRRTLRQKAYEEERKEIYKKLNSFYGPFQQLSGISLRLIGLLREGRSPDFHVLPGLLNGDTFEGNDRILLKELMEVTAKINDLIENQSGLIDDPKLQMLLWDISTHFRILHLAYEGSLTGEAQRFMNYTYPQEVDAVAKSQADKLRSRMDQLNRM